MRTLAGGVLMALMMCLTLISDIYNQGLLLWCAGVCGWCAIFCLFRDVKVTQRWRTVLMVLVGVVLLFIGADRTADVEWSRALVNNAGLVSMLTAVGFLRLIALPPESNNTHLPVGYSAYVKTLAGVCLFGSVINISAPVLFADRLHKHNALNRLASQSITRVFTATSTWSPFFGGMAAVLTYVPSMRLPFVMMACFPFAVVSFLVVVAEGRWRYMKDLQRFRGYPVNFFNLWIPAALGLIIVLLSQTLPQWSVLTHISLSALILSVFVLCWRNGVQRSVRTLGSFVVADLPKMINELQLFFAAGVLAAGLAAVISTEWLPALSGFSALSAALLLGAIILLAIGGVHPIVTITGATPLIMTLQPNPDLLAVCFLLGWGLGTCASPLSGTHLVFQGRYGIPSIKGALWNWPYVAFMYLVAVLLLELVAMLL